VIGKFLAFRDQGAGADQASLADPRAVEHHGLDPDQRTVAHRAAVQHGLVADRHVLADLERVARIGVHHGAFLNIAVLADRDGLVVAAQRGAEPYRRIRGEPDPAHQGGRVGDERRRIDLGRMLAQLVNSHGGARVGGNGAILPPRPVPKSGRWGRDARIQPPARIIIRTTVLISGIA